jgi:hypothetical protein
MGASSKVGLEVGETNFERSLVFGHELAGKHKDK